MSSPDWTSTPRVPAVSTEPPPAELAGPNGAPTVPLNSEPIDPTKVDPLSHHAVAVRLPNGMRPRIDGRMDDQVWQLAPAMGNFVQTEPDVGLPATQPTEFRILYDDRALYVGLWMFDREPSGIRASELKRDALQRKGDQIKITLDPFYDRRNAFYFGTNPLGAYKDGNMTENGRTMNWDWTVNWLTRTTRDEHGWFSELEVPLSQIRYRESAGETLWGVQVCRVLIRKAENSCWTPFPREWGQGGVFRMSNAGVLHGITGLRSRRRVEFVPYIQPAVVRDYLAATPTAFDTGYGADLRVGLSPTLTADFTLKTDFAQVEADEEIVNLSRFNLFFPEKRQFFTEAAGIFDYGLAGSGRPGRTEEAGLLQLFYSRRIGLDRSGRQIPILGGARVTGRAGEYTLGFMNIQTEQKLFNGSGVGEAVPTANYSVLRVKRNILSQSTIGAVLTNRQDGGGTDAYNRAAGVDLGFRFGTALSVTGLAAKTFSPGSDGRDAARAIDVDYLTDRFNASATHLDIGERFNAEMGFVPRVDTRRTSVRGAWTPWPGWPGFRSLDFNGALDYFENHRNVMESRTQSVGFGFWRRDNSRFSAAVGKEFDLLTDAFQLGSVEVLSGGHSWNYWNTTYSTDQSRRIYGGARVNGGGYYNGDRTSVGGDIAFLPLETLLVEIAYTRNHISVPRFERYVTNTVNARVSHSFTPDLFVKSFMQYNDARRIANINLLLWYRYMTGSDLYIVYNQGWNSDLAAPRDFNLRDRTLQIKLTYWWAR